MHRVALKAAALTLLIAVAAGVAADALTTRERGRRAGHADEDYLTSTSCRSCHPGHYESWARTFHSRMTREAQPDTVRGDFAVENEYQYLGVKARMTRRDGAHFMDLDFPDGRSQNLKIGRIVGSRRIEQYLTQGKGGYTRLPLAYDLINRRWMSLNGSFFRPDSNDYFQHLASWDANCVFCHNVKAQPHLDRARREFQTEVAELGIACGACHGPGAAHADAARAPWRRTFWRISDGEPREIVNPRRLTPERSMMVCGHCHGQRIPEPVDRIEEILSRGDPFQAGEDLNRYYRPVWRETRIGNHSFANRFWADGSPRLTAYEYQGLLRSKCYQEGAPESRINCLTCHSMHDGDPRGQLTAEMRTDRPCLSCHQQYEGREALFQHTRHAPDGAGSRCYNCHMPRVVFGVMAVHPSHEISVPRPALTAAVGVPNACNQCHLDRSVNWAIGEARRLWPKRFAMESESDDAQFNQMEGVRALFAGDALTRSLAAEAIAGGGPVKPDPNWAAPWLLEACADDYPIVRFFAAGGLAAIDPRAPRLDYLGVRDAREAMRERLWARYGANTRARIVALAQTLRARRSATDIEVGE